MQLFLLVVTIILCIVLYRMLSSQRATYPFVRTTQYVRTEDNTEYATTEAEQGLITIDKDTVIVNGQEYSLKKKKAERPEAYLHISEGKLLNVCIHMEDGDKFFYIDPEHNLFLSTYQNQVSEAHSHHHMFSF